MAETLRTYAFFDGAYVREGLEAAGAAWQDLNLREVAYAAPSWVGNKWQELQMRIGRVFVYDAVPEGAPEDHDVERWLRRNGNEMDVHIRRGVLVGTPPRQKGVDVQLAVDALSLASNGVYDVALLVAGDGDLAPVVEAVRFKGPLVAVCCFRNSISRELRKEADRVGYLPDDPNAWAAWRLPDD